MKKIILGSLALAGIIALVKAQQAKSLETVNYVDLNKYLGKWYDVASFPQRFSKGCSCTSAEYSLNTDGSIKVVNTCNKDGKPKVSEGKAVVVDKTTNAKLEVTFFWPFSGKYWIIDLADDYSYAVVGHPNRQYLWILSRTPKMNEVVFKQVVNRVRELGFDITKLQSTDQSCYN